MDDKRLQEVEAIARDTECIADTTAYELIAEIRRLRPVILDGEPRPPFPEEQD